MILWAWKIIWGFSQIFTLKNQLDHPCNFSPNLPEVQPGVVRGLAALRRWCPHLLRLHCKTLHPVQNRQMLACRTRCAQRHTICKNKHNYFPGHSHASSTRCAIPQNKMPFAKSCYNTNFKHAHMYKLESELLLLKTEVNSYHFPLCSKNTEIMLNHYLCSFCHSKAGNIFTTVPVHLCPPNFLTTRLITLRSQICWHTVTKPCFTLSMLNVVAYAPPGCI